MNFLRTERAAPRERRPQGGAPGAAHPSSPSRQGREMDHQPSRMTMTLGNDCHVVTPEEQASKWKKKGLCHTCGKVKTHSVTLGMRTRLTIKNQVYKGQCLTCKSMTKAKLDLGERVEADMDIMNSSGLNSSLVREPSIMDATVTRGKTPSGSGSGSSGVSGDGRVQERSASPRGEMTPPRSASLETPHPPLPAAHVTFAGHDDEISVFSDVTLDPGLTSTRPSLNNNDREEYLEKIEEEERNSNEIASIPGSARGYDRNSSGDVSDTRSHNRSVSQDSNLRQQSQPGAVSVRAPPMDRLLERKMKANEAKSSFNHNRTRSDFNPRTAPNDDSMHTRSASYDRPGAPGVQAVKNGDPYATIYDRKLKEEKTDKKYIAPSTNHDHEETGYTRSDSIQSKASKPGVQSVKNGDGHTLLYNKKIAAENRANDKAVAPGVQSVKNGDNHSTLFDKKMAEEKLMRENRPQKDAASDISDPHDLIDFLQNNPTSPHDAILKALEQLRNCLVSEHGVADISSKSSVSMDQLDGPRQSNLVFGNSEWVNFLTVLSAYPSNRTVQSSVLRTLWIILTLHPQYISDFTSNADMEQCMEHILTTMETHGQDESVQYSGCGVLACLAKTEKHALCLMEMCEGKIIHRLMAALYCPGDTGNVQDNALKALFRLSSAFLSDDNATENLTHKMGKYIEVNSQDGGDASVKAIVAVLNAIENYPENSSLQINGIWLLWYIFTPDSVMDPDYIDILAGNILKYIKAVMSPQQYTQAVYESAVCLLSKMSCFNIFESGVQEKFLTITLGAMRAYSSSSVTIAKNGCRCLANIFARASAAPSSAPAVNDGISEILSSMVAFKGHIAVQSEACAALSAMCINSPSNKDHTYKEKGIDLIKHVYDLCSKSLYEGPCLMAGIRACTAFTTLAVDPIILSDLRDKGIISEFQRVLEEEDLPDDLRNVIDDMLVLASDKDEQNLLFQVDATEEETFHCIRANLRILMTSEHTPSRIVDLRSCVLNAMKAFQSADVHESGCCLLACAYSLDSSKSLPVDFAEELEMLAQSIADHSTTSTNVIAACSAVQNVCVMISQSNNNTDSDILLTERLQRNFNEVSRMIAIHRENKDAMEQATGALHALCTLRGGMSLSFETDSTIELLVEAMDKHTSSDLQRNCVGILGSFFSVSNRTLDFLNDGVVDSILQFIQKEADHEDAADSIDTAINTLLLMTNAGFQGVMTVLRNEKLLDSIVSCMFACPNSSSIQSACIELLTNVALDNLLRVEVCTNGGTSRIISALRTHKDDSLVVCKAFAALSNLISGADVDILQAHDAPAAKCMVHALESHPQNLSVQIAGAYAMWALSARGDSFKGELVRLRGAELIAQSMKRFIGSKEMQGKGFVILWSLSVPKPLKARVGRCGIEPLVNGLCAHGSSEKICEEALGCLKCLSTIPANKQLLEECDAVEVIYSCIWFHINNSSVCKSALSALANVSVNLETNEVSEITEDDLKCICYAMRAHQRYKPLQESAMVLLRNFTFLRSNVAIMENNQYLVPLIKQAMSTHNDNFQNRGDDLLRVLPAMNQ